MKKTIAVCMAALIAAASSGCTVVSRFEVPEDELAYSRVLYPDGTYVSEEDDEEIIEESISVEVTEEEEKPQEKTSHEDNKSENKNKNKSASDSSKKTSNADVKKAASSKKTVSQNSSKARKVKVYHLTNSKKINSSRSSDTDSDSDTKSHKTEEQQIIIGSFEELDLSYDAGKDYLDFGDDETFVRKTMGEPIAESQDGDLKLLTYKKCVVTLKQLSEDTEPVLVRIEIPEESIYKTIKKIETEASREKVLEVYGEPTDILTVYPEQAEEQQTVSDEVTEHDSEQEIESEPLQETDIPIDTEEEETDAASSDITESEPEKPEPLYEIFTYSIGDKSFVLRIEQNIVVYMEYVWDI